MCFAVDYFSPHDFVDFKYQFQWVSLRELLEIGFIEEMRTI